MDNPRLMMSRGLGQRKHVANMDRVNPNTSDALDNRAMGIASLVARALMDVDAQVPNPTNTRQQSSAVAFSNNTNQIRNGTYSEPNIATNQFAKLERRRSGKRNRRY